MPASTVFQATCPNCDEDANLIEFKVEACVQPDGGPPKAWRGFKCLACGKRCRQTEGPDGLHKWDGDEHVVVARDGS